MIKKSRSIFGLWIFTWIVTGLIYLFWEEVQIFYIVAIIVWSLPEQKEKFKYFMSFIGSVVIVCLLYNLVCTDKIAMRANHVYYTGKLLVPSGNFVEIEAKLEGKFISKSYVASYKCDNISDKSTIYEDVLLRHGYKIQVKTKRRMVANQGEIYVVITFDYPQNEIRIFINTEDFFNHNGL